MMASALTCGNITLRCPGHGVPSEMSGAVTRADTRPMGRSPAETSANASPQGGHMPHDLPKHTQNRE